MIIKLIEEINLALEHDLFLVALEAALTLPDICGRAKYPKEGNKQRYTKWYKEHVEKYEYPCMDESDDYPFLSAEVVYSLRCSLSHQGTPNVNKKTGIDEFILSIESKEDFSAYYDVAGIYTEEGETKKRYRVSIRRICSLLCRTTQIYYEQNREQFNFFNYKITQKQRILK